MYITFERDGDVDRLRRMIWAASRKNIRRVWTFAGVFLVLGAALVGFQTAGRFGSSIGYAFVGIAVIYALLPLLAVRRQTRRLAPLFSEPARYTVTDTEITVENDAATQICRWSGFTGVREIGGFWLCMNRAKIPSVIIPQDCMSAGDQVEFRTFLATRGVAPAEYRL